MNKIIRLGIALLMIGLVGMLVNGIIVCATYYQWLAVDSVEYLRPGYGMGSVAWIIWCVGVVTIILGVVKGLKDIGFRNHQKRNPKY